MNHAPTEDVNFGSQSNKSSPAAPRRSPTPQQSGQIQNSNHPSVISNGPTTINIGSGSFNATSHAGKLFLLGLPRRFASEVLMFFSAYFTIRNQN